MISLSNSATGAPTASFGGSQYGMATGRTANFNYGTLGNGGVKPMGQNPMSVPSSTVRAPSQLLPNQSMGIQPAQAPQQQQQSGGGRGASFMKGMGEGAPTAGAGEAAAGAGEAAAGGAEAGLGDLAAAALI